MRGFILNFNTSFKENSGDEHFIFGVLENRKNFVWKITKPLYLGFTRENLAETDYHKKIAGRFKDFRNNLLNCYFFSSKQQIFEAEKKNSHLDMQEKEVNPIIQFLMAKGIKSQVNFLSQGEEKQGIVFFSDPKVEKDDFSLSDLNLNVVSVDIETRVKDKKLYSIALCNDEHKKVLFNRTAFDVRDGEFVTEVYPDEKKLLLAFKKEIELINPHVIMGWNIVGFDFDFLHKKFSKHQIPFDIGFNGMPVTRFTGQRSKKLVINIPGRVFLEGIEVLKWFYPSLSSYSLDNVAREVMSEGKTIEKKDWEKIKEIDFLYEHKPNELAVYNFKDAKLVFDLICRVDGLNFMLQRTKLSGVTLERLKNPNEILDNFYLPLLHKKYFAAYSPLKRKPIHFQNENISYFMPGFYQNVCKVDFSGILEDMVISYRIDPLGMIQSTVDNKFIGSTPRGSSFHIRENILPYVFLQLKKELEMDKVCAVKTKAIQVLMENLLTALNNFNSRFFLPGLYSCLKDNALFIIEKITSHLKANDFEIVYFDRQTIIFRFLENELTKKMKQKMFNVVNDELLQKVIPKWNFARINSQRFFKHIFIPSQIGKNSFLEFFAEDENGEESSFIHKKNDLPMANEMKRAIILKAFQGSDLASFLKTIKCEMLRGDWDEKLVYEETIYKKIDDLSSKSSPAIEAAKQIKDYWQDYYDLGYSRINVKYIYTMDKNIVAISPDEKNLAGFLKMQKLDYAYYLEKEIYNSLKNYFQDSLPINALKGLKITDFQLDFFG